MFIDNLLNFNKMEEKMFSTKKTYVKTDGWRGYEQPIYAVFGWNDTGTWSDSPCNTYKGIKESKLAKTFLRKNRIPFRHIVCRTSNIFCIHHYLIVDVTLLETAKTLVSEFYETIKDETELLYVV